MATIGDARTLVIERIADQARRFPVFDLRPLETASLSDRDAGLARAIDQAVNRRWATLATVLDACLDQAWADLEPAVQAPLLVGAAQLLLLERIPEHAAISEAVDAAKRGPRPRSSGLINAVLRRVARLRAGAVDTHDGTRLDEIAWSDGRALRLTEPVLAGDPAQRLSQQSSCSVPLIQRWIELYGDDETTALAMHSIIVPPIIVSGIPLDRDDVVPHADPGHAVYTGPRSELRRVLQAIPEAIVQDPGAAAAVRATSSMSPGVIIDVCAGRGTKTRQLAQLHPDAKIIASDRDKRRLADLRTAVAGNDRIIICEPRQLIEHAGIADLVVLDVPCSNTGVLARRPEARHRYEPRSRDGLIDVQRQIIADALPLRAPSGTILYSTCSIDPAENQDQASWISRWHDLEAISTWSRLPTGGPGDPPETYRDGGYFALLRA